MLALILGVVHCSKVVTRCPAASVIHWPNSAHLGLPAKEITLIKQYVQISVSGSQARNDATISSFCECLNLKARWQDLYQTGFGKRQRRNCGERLEVVRLRIRQLVAGGIAGSDCQAVKARAEKGELVAGKRQR